MRFCFIVEEQYRNDPMPMVIADQLLQWGHDVDLLEPQTAVTCLSDLAQQGYDAYVLKSLADGPGLSILEAAEAVGIPTFNNSRSIRLLRVKAVAAALAHSPFIFCCSPTVTQADSTRGVPDSCQTEQREFLPRHLST